MLEVLIPKDIRKYDAKLIGPFTTRQLICFVGGSVLAYGFYKVFGYSLGRQTAIMACSIVASPFLIMGWYRPYGMHFEKFFKSAFISTILSPRNRKYKTKNLFSGINDSLKPTNKSEYQKRMKKEKKLVKKQEKYTSYK